MEEERPLDVVKLWQAVLLDAVRLAPRTQLRRWEQGANMVAREWVMDESLEVGAFRWVCDILGEDFRVVRRRAMSGERVPQRRVQPRAVA